MRSIKTHTQESILKDFAFPFFLSFTCTHIMLGADWELPYLELLLKADYLKDFIPRGFLTFVVTLLIKYTSNHLDFSRPWKSGIWTRLFFQFCCAFIGAVIFDFFASAGYCWAKGMDISDTQYSNIYFLPICTYIVMVNTFYMYKSYSAEREILIEPKAEQSEQELLDQKRNAEIARIAEEMGVVYICTSEKIIFAKNINGDLVSWNTNITHSSAGLPTDHFFAINRGIIVHRSIIAQAKLCPKRHKTIVELKPQFKESLDLPKSKDVIFNLWLAQK